MRRASRVATDAFMSCWTAKAGSSTSRKAIALNKELGVQLRHKTPKRRVNAKLWDDRVEAVGPNDVWAMDFVHDQLATVKKLGF